MATTWTNNTAAWLKSGPNCSITDCTTRDDSSTYLGGTKPLIGVIYKKVICMRLKVTPTKRVKSVSLTINNQNKSHGYGNYVTYYAKASTSASAWPASYKTTSDTQIGQLSTSGSFSFSISFTATDSPFYVYVWGYLVADSEGEHDQYINNVYSVSCSAGGVSIYAKSSGGWALVKDAFAKSDSWKALKSAYGKSDAWKESK